MGYKRKEVREHLDKVSQIVCLVCKTPFVNLHHIRPKGTGVGRRTSDWCESKYGKEIKLLERVIRVIYKKDWKRIWKEKISF